MQITYIDENGEFPLPIEWNPASPFPAIKVRWLVIEAFEGEADKLVEAMAKAYPEVVEDTI